MDHEIEQNLSIGLQEDEPKGSSYKARQFFDSTFAILATTAILFFIGVLIQLFVPNPIDTAFIEQTFISPLKYFLPENPEKYQYIVLTVMYPILFFIFYFIFGKLKPENQLVESSQYMYPFIFIGTVTLFYLVNLSDTAFLELNMFYISPIVAILLTLLMLFLIYRYHYAVDKKMDPIGFGCLIFMILAAVFTASLFITTSFSDAGLYNIDAYYDAIFEVYSGKSPVIDFSNQYGFYPYFFLVAFKLMGGISITKFSCIMGILSLIVFLSLLAVIWMNVKNKVLAAVGYVTLLFFMIYVPFMESPGFYFQYQPHRLIYPSLILLVACLWIRTQKRSAKKLFSALAYILGYFAIVWNTETGLVVVAAWCLFRIYGYVQQYSFKEKALYIQSIKSGFLAVVAVSGAFFSMMLITYLRSGIWTSIGDMLFVQTFFYNVGFFMLPMYIVHPWVLLVIVYALGLMQSIRDIKFFRRDKPSTCERAPLYFIISVLGMGLFSYFQGRSHNFVLVDICWSGILLVIFYTQDCIDRLPTRIHLSKQEKPLNRIHAITNIGKSILLTAFLVSYALSAPYFIATNGMLGTLCTKSNFYDNETVVNRLSFIRECAEGDENLDLLVYQPSYYYTKLGLENHTDLVSNVYWFLKSDQEEAFVWLEETEDMVFFDSKMIKYLKKYDSQRFQSILDTRFTHVGDKAGFYCYKPK